jgi:hypothetical protein
VVSVPAFSCARVPVEYVVFVAFIVTVFAVLVRVTLLPAFISIVLAADPSYVYKLVFSDVPVSNFNINLLLTLVAELAFPVILIPQVPLAPVPSV